ncbi:PAS domain-containing protein [Streptomyces sp. KR80]|uniref:PAS domain-containing protein n=1 Tax=Streptomyces sp. KR80 TaxID=3457426 RepID=UPI003FCF7F4A
MDFWAEGIGRLTMGTADTAKTLGPFGAPPLAAAVLNEDGVLVSWGGAAEQMLGYPARDVIGTPGVSLLYQQADAAAVREIVEGSPAETGRDGLLGIRHRDGHRVDVGARCCPISGPDKERYWLVLAFEVARMPWWTSERSLLDQLPAQAPVGMAVVDPDLRCVWLNDALVRSGGVPREERIGRRLTEALPGLLAEDIEAQMRRVLDTGSPVVDHMYRGRTAVSPFHRTSRLVARSFRVGRKSVLGIAVRSAAASLRDCWSAGIVSACV